MDVRVNTAHDTSSSDKKFCHLMNVGPAISRVLQARLRRAGYTMGFPTHL